MKICANRNPLLKLDTSRGQSARLQPPLFS